LRAPVSAEPPSTKRQQRSACRVCTTPQQLRHTAASLAIAAGANVELIQQMLGHKSATKTLDQYGHLFGDRLDQIADALNAAVLTARQQTAATTSSDAPVLP
jgi:integrase